MSINSIILTIPYILESDEKLRQQLITQQATAKEDLKSCLVESDEKLRQQLITQQTTAKEDIKALAKQIEGLLKPPDNQCVSIDAG